MAATASAQTSAINFDENGTGVYLIIDTRERDIQNAFGSITDCPTVAQRLYAGDFIIVVGNFPIAIIERKSLIDFAYSFKDGRYENREKLIAFRESYTGKSEFITRAFILIEGVLPSDPETMISGIKWKTIESAIFHMALRDDIGAIYSLNIADTAAKLFRMMQSVANLCKTPLRNVHDYIGNIDSKKIGAAHRVEQTVLFREALCSLPRIGTKSADKLLATKKTIREMLRDGLITIPNHAIFIAAGVRGISAKGAEAIVAATKDKYDLLADAPASVLAGIQISASRKLGLSVAERIHQLYNGNESH
ncbi:MAG: hypothetical protein M0R33_15585 [Methylomonas sp.]|jgi:ERCC4-type nuclease|uniref:ERCC4 domain-containing protein n=1 Tax=Methylomonas sp. TaxID=418 RepID=UPI0025DC80E4|nr:ERCC4 domain-containing protein [Methylomonas sp.]MCK9607865.1 hypothetical protein [Methylomonas sp.]